MDIMVQGCSMSLFGCSKHRRIDNVTAWGEHVLRKLVAAQILPMVGFSSGAFGGSGSKLIGGASSASGVCDGPDKRPPDLAPCSGGTLRKAASPDDRAADRERRCTQDRLSRIRDDAPFGDAVSRPAPRWHGREIGRMVERRSPVRHLWHAALCPSIAARHRRRAECCAGNVERWANRRPDQQARDAEPASRQIDAVTELDLAPKVHQTQFTGNLTSEMPPA